MKSSWTRREVIGMSFKGSLFLLAGTTPALIGCIDRSPRLDAWQLRGVQRRTLAAVLEETIPESDGMPTANSDACLDYLETVCRESAAVQDALERSLDRLRTYVGHSSHKELSELAAADRNRLLAAFEREDAEAFGLLRVLAYEAYYTNPLIWSRLDYHPHPTSHAGPTLFAFDPERLSRVRLMAPMYREVI